MAANIPAVPEGAPSPTTAELLESRRKARVRSAWFLGVMILVVIYGVTVLEWAYGHYPIPPGGDAGKWIATSFAYIGWPYPAPGSFSSPFSYAPMTFPILGSAVLLTNSPLSGGIVFGGFLLAAYGLSTVFLARRYLAIPLLQLGFVILVILNLTTFSILFWGGYPNFLGFTFLTLSIVFLLEFVRRRTLVSSLLLWGSLAALYLTHDLTFAIGLAAVSLALLVLLVFGRFGWRVLVGRANLLGMSVLASTIAIYSLVTRSLALGHPGYLFANPAAYALNPINLIFRPLTLGCLCPGDNISIPGALLVLLAVPTVVLVALFGFRKRRILAPFAFPVRGKGGLQVGWVRPRFVNEPLLIVASWVSAVCLVPAFGWAVQIGTDYSRFAYFFPLPILLLIVLLIERFSLPWLAHLVTPVPRPVRTPDNPPAGASVESVDESGPDVVTPPSDTTYRAHGTRVARVLTVISVVVIAVVLAVQIVPFANRQEQHLAGPYGDTVFLSTLNWIDSSATPGSVLADNGHSAHWVEAVAARDAYFPGPTWLSFYPSQILRDEQSYWALNTEYAVTNNNLVFSYSGANDTVLREMPMYTAYVQGVQFPLLRIIPGSMAVGYGPANGTGNGSTSPSSSWSGPTLNVTDSPAPAGELGYSAGSLFSLSELDQLGVGGHAWMNFTVTPMSGWRVSNLTLELSQPPGSVKLVRFGSVSGASAGVAGFTWNVSGHLGNIPGPYTTHTTGSFSSPSSSSVLLPLTGHPTGMRLRFNNPTPGQPLHLSISLYTPSTSNPAIHLPWFFDTEAFYASLGISTVLAATPLRSLNQTVQYLQEEFGFTRAYSNVNWTVLDTQLLPQHVAAAGAAGAALGSSPDLIAPGSRIARTGDRP